MKYTLTQHLLGLNDEEFDTVKNHQPVEEIQAEPAECDEAKIRSTSLFKAAIAELVENERDPEEAYAEQQDMKFERFLSDVNGELRTANQQEVDMTNAEEMDVVKQGSQDAQNYEAVVMAVEVIMAGRGVVGEGKMLKGALKQLVELNQGYLSDEELLGRLSYHLRKLGHEDPATERDLNNNEIGYVDSNENDSVIFDMALQIADFREQNSSDYKHLRPEEEEESSMPATRDRVQGISDDMAKQRNYNPSNKRGAQRAGRNLRRRHGVQQPGMGASNAADIYDEEEESAKAPVDREKHKMAVDWVKNLPPKVSNKRGQQSGNRAMRRMTGKPAGYDR